MRGLVLRLAVVTAAAVAVCMGAKAVASYADAHAHEIAVFLIAPFI